MGRTNAREAAKICSIWLIMIKEKYVFGSRDWMCMREGQLKTLFRWLPIYFTSGHPLCWYPGGRWRITPSFVPNRAIVMYRTSASPHRHRKTPNGSSSVIACVKFMTSSRCMNETRLTSKWFEKRGSLRLLVLAQVCLTSYHISGLPGVICIFSTYAVATSYKFLQYLGAEVVSRWMEWYTRWLPDKPGRYKFSSK